MNQSDEVIQLLREMRDLQRQLLEEARDRWAQQDIEWKRRLESDEERYAQYRAQNDIEWKRWFEFDKERYAQYRSDYLADAAKNTSEYERWVRSYVGMTAAFTAGCILIVVGFAAGVVFLLSTR